MDDPDRASEQQARLRRMKWLASGLLLAMACVFAATYMIPRPPGWLGYLRAFTEAAMVGALADWFAVTALFRRPLGLPIPHTAIVPRRKDEIGDSLAAFVREHFMTGDALAPKLAGIDFAARIAEWLRQPRNARRLTGDLTGLAAWLLETVDDAEMRDFFRMNLHVSLREVQVTPIVGRALDLLISADRHQELMDTAVRLAHEQLMEHKLKLREKIERESPWWMPGFVDREIYDKIVGEIEHVLARIGHESDHPARLRFNDATRELIERMKNDPEIIERGETLKEELLSHPAVQGYLGSLWTQTREHLLNEARRPESYVHQRAEKGIVHLGEALLATPAIREQVNAWLTEALLHLVENYREEIASVISDTVRAWDANETSRRVELQVGRDLQFIRINGTLVGGLAGLGIYALVQAFVH